VLNLSSTISDHSIPFSNKILGKIVLFCYYSWAILLCQCTMNASLKRLVHFHHKNASFHLRHIFILFMRTPFAGVAILSIAMISSNNRAKFIDTSTQLTYILFYLDFFRKISIIFNQTILVLSDSIFKIEGR
jgi:hypothetical protein